MILKREFDIIKKLYIPPHIDFEELEVDPILDAEGSTAPWEGDEGDPDPNSLDVKFGDDDFIMNDVNSEFDW